MGGGIFWITLNLFGVKKLSKLMYVFDLKILFDKVNLSTVRCCYLAKLWLYSVRPLKGCVKFLLPETVVVSFCVNSQNVTRLLWETALCCAYCLILVLYSALLCRVSFLNERMFFKVGYYIFFLQRSMFINRSFVTVFVILLCCYFAAVVITCFHLTTNGA